jgi:hypothetical protein
MSRTNSQPCGHLADGHGFYTRRVESFRQYYSASGEASGTDDGVNNRPPRGGNIAYCENCNKRLGRLGYRNNRATIEGVHDA